MLLTTMSIIAALLPAAQQPENQSAPARQDLRALAERVDRVHRGETSGRQLPGFHASLVLQNIAKEAEQRIEAGIDIRFLKHRKTGSDRDLDLMRYKLVDASQPVERGRDPNGRYWGIIDDKVQGLSGRGLETDLQEAKDHLRLAGQMLRFLDPAAVLRELRRPKPVAEETLRQGRTKPIVCQTVTGIAESFPMRSQAGDELPVRLKVFIDKESGRLIAVEACPFDKTGRPIESHCEFIRLGDHADYGGVLLPTRITHSIGPAGRRQGELRITLNTIDLDARLIPSDFDRPRTVPKKD